MTRSLEQGYARIAGEGFDRKGVQWWFFRQDGDWAFARGGNVRSNREARKAIRDALTEYGVERSRFLARPSHVMEKDGSLRPIQRGWST